MAFTTSIKTNAGISVSAAYCKVENLALLNKTLIQFNVKAFASIDNSTSFWQQGYTCIYDLDGPNPIKQAYEYLKTLPEFSNATDC